jgi:hypothetical protein
MSPRGIRVVRTVVSVMPTYRRQRGCAAAARIFVIAANRFQPLMNATECGFDANEQGSMHAEGIEAKRRVTKTLAVAFDIVCSR